MTKLKIMLLLILGSVEYLLASDCYTSENIECTCEEYSASCLGVQHELAEVQNVLVNISSIYTVKDLLFLFLNIDNLTFPTEFTFSDFKLRNLTIEKELENIHDDLFSGLNSSLTSLHLQFNKLPLLYNQPFSQLYNLKELKLEFNNLHRINSDLMTNLSRLEFLSLSGNALDEIDKYLLVNLPVIQELDLSNNNISFISNINIMSHTLEKLVMRNCSVNGSIQKEFLSGASKLEQVDFSENRITSIGSYAMSELNQLKFLNLSYNMLETLEQHALSSLYNLKSLDLKNNKLSVITKTSFLNLTSLTYLDLSENLIEAVLEEYTSDLHSLESINLVNNNIKIIMPGTFSSCPNLQKLFLKGNTWDCICELSSFVVFLTDNSHLIDDINELKCASPTSLQGTSLTNVDFIPLNCDYKEETEEDYNYEDSDHQATENGTTSLDSVTEMYSATEQTSTYISDNGTLSSFLTSEYNTSTTEESSPTEENTSSEVEETSSTLSSLITSASTIPLKVTSNFPKVVTDLNVTVLNYTVLDKDFCIRWTMSRLTLNNPVCSVKLNTREGSKSKNLKCPTDGNEIQQCLSYNEVYAFCININVKAQRISQSCTTIPTVTTLEYKSETSTDNTSTFFSTSELSTVVSSTIQLIDTTRKLPSTTDTVFKVTKFDAIFNYSNSSVALNWSVSKNEPQSVCKMTLILATHNYNHTVNTFKCSSNTYQIISIKEQGSFKVCLAIAHNYHKPNLICKSYNGQSYGIQGSRTKDDSYKNSSLIAVVCLLIVVAFIILVILSKKLLKKRIETDRYNVYEEEQNVQKRISSQFRPEPCVRYSYTLKEQGEI